MGNKMSAPIRKVANIESSANIDFNVIEHQSAHEDRMAKGVERLSISFLRRLYDVTLRIPAVAILGTC
jgi:hypothetical protein